LQQFCELFRLHAVILPALLAALLPSTLRAQLLIEEDPEPFPQARSKESFDVPLESIRMGLIDSGVNYLLPEISRSLIRTPEGEFVGYDFWDMDERPFDAHPGKGGTMQRHGTQTASVLLREADFVKLVP